MGNRHRGPERHSRRAEHHLATSGGWLWAAIFGAALPITALAEWVYLRRRSDDARRAADRMLIFVLWALIGLGDASGAF